MTPVAPDTAASRAHVEIGRLGLSLQGVDPAFADAVGRRLKARLAALYWPAPAASIALDRLVVPPLARRAGENADQLAGRIADACRDTLAAAMAETRNPAGERRT